MAIPLPADQAVAGGNHDPKCTVRNPIARRRAADLGLPVTFRVADLYALTPQTDGAELVVCCEVLEQLSDPAARSACSPAWPQPNLIVSVPREPLWRMLNMARGGGARQHGRASATLVRAALPRPARGRARGARGAHAAALDHGALPSPLRRKN